MISEEDYAELWYMWFGLEDSPTIVEKLREINHKYNLGLVEGERLGLYRYQTKNSRVEE